MFSGVCVLKLHSRLPLLPFGLLHDCLHHFFRSRLPSGRTSLRLPSLWALRPPPPPLPYWRPLEESLIDFKRQEADLLSCINFWTLNKASRGGFTIHESFCAFFGSLNICTQEILFKSNEEKQYAKPCSSEEENRLINQGWAIDKIAVKIRYFSGRQGS